MEREIGSSQAWACAATTPDQTSSSPLHPVLRIPPPSQVLPYGPRLGDKATIVALDGAHTPRIYVLRMVLRTDDSVLR